ncbi:MAG: nuclear transport factor 2 family protein [Spirosomataceae bacterium]
MKKIMLLLVPIFFYSALQAQTVDNQAVETADKQFEASFAAKNIEAMFQPVAADCIFYGTDPTERWDLTSFKKMIEAGMKNGVPAMSVLSREITSLSDGNIVVVVKKINWVIFKNELREIVVYEKQKEGWKMKTFSLNLLIPNQKITALNEMMTGK